MLCFRHQPGSAPACIRWYSYLSRFRLTRLNLKSPSAIWPSGLPHLLMFYVDAHVPGCMSLVPKCMHASHLHSFPCSGLPGTRFPLYPFMNSRFPSCASCSTPSRLPYLLEFLCLISSTILRTQIFIKFSTHLILSPRILSQPRFLHVICDSNPCFFHFNQGQLLLMQMTLSWHKHMPPTLLKQYPHSFMTGH
jgi:hypothetical protein